MQLTLKNIGIVGDATVKLNGLTVVTGANNSGKTTVGRAVYSLVSAVENLQRNAVLDKLAYVQSAIASLLDPIFFRSFLMEQDAVNGDARMVSIEDIIGFIDQVCKKVVATEKSFFEQNLKSLGISASPSKVEKIFQDFLKRQPAIVDDLKSLRNAMLKDSDCRLILRLIYTILRRALKRFWSLSCSSKMDSCAKTPFSSWMSPKRGCTPSGRVVRRSRCPPDQTSWMYRAVNYA